MDGRIAVLEAPETISVESFEVPEPDEDEVVVRIDLAGLDGTDVKNYLGDLPDSELSRYPQVLSDEIVGTVESIGASAADCYAVARGDRAIVGPRITCGNCEYCESGNHAHCAEMRTYGRLDPREPPHFTGGCAEYLLVQPGSNVYPVPDGVSDVEALLASVTLADGLRSASLAGVEPGDAVVVLGPGPQGLSCALGARVRGATQIAMVGLPADRLRLEFATDLGVTDTGIAPDGDIEMAALDALDGELADVVFECTGVADVLEDAVELVRPEGVCQFVTMSAGEATIDPFDLVMREISLIPRRGPTPEFVRRALRGIQSWDVPVTDVVTDTVGLESVGDACRRASAEDDLLKMAVGPRR